MKIIENVYLVPGVTANPYLVADEDGFTLIDAGLPRSEKKITDYLAGLGKSAGDIRRIVLTHSDMDHVGSLAALKRLSGARTYAGQIEADAIAAGKPSRQIQSRGFSPMRLIFALLRPFFKVEPMQVDEILSEGRILPVLGGLQIIATPGHTPGHISLYSESTGVLFCGDSMVTEKDSIQGSRPPVTWDEAKARESVVKQSKLAPRIVCPGHGPVVADAARKIPV